MKRNSYIIIGSIIIYLFLLFFCHYNYNDPDSYYYLSIAKHIEKSDNTLLGNILYDNGLFVGKILLAFCLIISAFLVYDLCNIVNKKWSILGFIFMLFTPFVFFMNGWYGRLDKNAIELLLFCMFTLIITSFFYKQPVEINALGIKHKQHWSYNFLFYMVIFFIMARYFWQGYYIFIIILAMFYVLYVIVFRKINKYSVFIIALCLCLGLYYYLKIYNHSYGLILEDRLTLYDFLFPEYLMFISLLLINMVYDLILKVEKDIDFYIYCGIILSLTYFMPRLILFTVPLMCILMMMALNKNVIGKFFVILFITWLLIQSIMYLGYFNKPVYNDILSQQDPCITQNIKNCTIIGDWGYGHVYRYAWNETVLYKGHPTNISDELDYLYYKNKTCANCVYIIPDNFTEMFEYYAKNI